MEWTENKRTSIKVENQFVKRTSIEYFFYLEYFISKCCYCQFEWWTKTSEQSIGAGAKTIWKWNGRAKIVAPEKKQRISHMMSNWNRAGINNWLKSINHNLLNNAQAGNHHRRTSNDPSGVFRSIPIHYISIKHKRRVLYVPKRGECVFNVPVCECVEHVCVQMDILLCGI